MDDDQGRQTLVGRVSAVITRRVNSRSLRWKESLIIIEAVNGITPPYVVHKVHTLQGRLLYNETQVDKDETKKIMLFTMLNGDKMELTVVFLYY